jgi:hypothetical protein
MICGDNQLKGLRCRASASPDRCRMIVARMLNRTQDGEPEGHRRGGRGETGEDRNERRARELAELLQELRVMLPCVQVLFAFLLTVPFAARFGAVTPLQDAVFFKTLVCTALSAGLLLSPSAHHGLLCRHGRPGNIACGWRIVSPSRA